MISMPISALTSSQSEVIAPFSWNPIDFMGAFDQRDLGSACHPEGWDIGFHDPDTPY